jgi:heterodisulfide reductase subunit B
MKKYTKAIAGAMALVSAVTAFSGCSGSGTPAQLSYNINKHYNQALFREKMSRRTI